MSDLVASGEVWLAAVRVWAILRMQVGWRVAVGPAWPVVALALAGLTASGLAVRGGAPSPGSFEAGSWLLLAGSEFALGSAVGALASLPAHALLGGAGAQAAALRVWEAPWRRFVVALVAVLAIEGGAHHALLRSLAEVFSLWPVGDPSAWALGDPWVALARGARGVVVLAFALASPVLLAAAVFELASALSSRAFGSVDVGAPVAVWLRTGAALLALLASWAAYPGAWAEGMGTAFVR